ERGAAPCPAVGFGGGSRPAGRRGHGQGDADRCELSGALGRQSDDSVLDDDEAVLFEGADGLRVELAERALRNGDESQGRGALLPERAFELPLFSRWLLADSA